MNKHAPGGWRCDDAVGRGERGRVWTTGEHNMERRKFVLGVGALAAGGAAAVGSGAFTQATATRQVEINVVDDTEGYMSFVVDDSEVANGQYATLNKNGEVVLSFTEEAGTNSFGGPAGQGVNTNSVYYFDGVFGIANQGQDESFTPQIKFNPADDTSNEAIGIYAVAAGSIDDEQDPDLTEANTASPGGLPPGTANYSVGVAIDTRGLSEGADISGTITVTAETDATAPGR